jgi:hypothetical protein
MDGVVLIEGKELVWLKQQIVLLQQQNLAILKQLQEIHPQKAHATVPDFISIQEACKKYHVSHVTINNKIKLFKKAVGRSIDRLRSGTYNLINELELQQALRLKSEHPDRFMRKSA